MYKLYFLSKKYLLSTDNVCLYCQVQKISISRCVWVEGSEWHLTLWPVQLQWINSPHKGLDWQEGLNNADISADWQHNRAKCFNASMLPLDWVYKDKWLMQKFMVLKTHFPAKCHPIHTAKQLKLWLLTFRLLTEWILHGMYYMPPTLKKK